MALALFPLVLLSASVALDTLLKSPRAVIKAIAAVAAILLVSEQISRLPNARTPIVNWQRAWETTAPEQGYSAFAIDYADGFLDPARNPDAPGTCVDRLLAMWAAYACGVPTINGYSGYRPAEASFLIGNDHYWRDIRAWLNHASVPPEQVAVLHFPELNWTPLTDLPIESTYPDERE